MFDTKIKLVKQKTQKFMISNVLLAQTQVKLKNSNFFHVFVQIFEINIIRKKFQSIWIQLLLCHEKNFLARAFVVF